MNKLPLLLIVAVVILISANLQALEIEQCKAYEKLNQQQVQYCDMIQFYEAQYNDDLRPVSEKWQHLGDVRLVEFMSVLERIQGSMTLPDPVGSYVLLNHRV